MFSPSSEEILSTVVAMRRQEETLYPKIDVLALEHETKLEIDEDCRNKMAFWCYQVADFCNMNRETVEIGMNYLDRYVVAAPASLRDRSRYQLASMTALYTAVKIHEPRVLDPNFIARMSQGIYLAVEIEEMERKMLSVLQWRMNPPTALSFCRVYLDLIDDNELSQPTKDAAYDLMQIQTEMAVGLYEYMTVKSSTLAYCALMNSLECLGISACILAEIQNRLLLAISAKHNPSFIHQISLAKKNLHSALAKYSCVHQTVASAVKRDATCTEERITSNNNNKRARTTASTDCQESPRCSVSTTSAL